MTSAIGMKGDGQGVVRITKHNTLKLYLDEELTMARGLPPSIWKLASRSEIDGQLVGKADMYTVAGTAKALMANKGERR